MQRLNVIAIAALIAFLGLNGTPGRAANAAAIPSSISGLAMWLDPSDASTVTQSAGLVSQLSDKSGNGGNAIQPKASMRPSLAPKALNGRAAIAFGAAKTVTGLTSAQGSFSSTISTFVVASLNPAGIVPQRLLGLGLGVTTGADTLMLVANVGATNGAFIANCSSAEGTLTNAGLNAPEFDIPTTAALLEATDDGIALIPYHDGISQQPRNGAALARSGYTLGFNHVASGQFWTGLIAEVIVYDRTLTTAERQRVEGYLAWKWGLQERLPRDHPYASAAPVAAAIKP
jgi:hypothetical protein